MYQDYLNTPKGFPKPYISITADDDGITALTLLVKKRR